LRGDGRKKPGFVEVLRHWRKGRGYEIVIMGDLRRLRDRDRDRGKAGGVTNYTSMPLVPARQTVIQLQSQL